MDGNRRWARQRGLPELDGHAAGVEAIREVLRHAVRRGVPVLTLYAFSRENWARSDDEVTRPVRPARGGHPQRDRRAAPPGRPGPAARPARGAADETRGSIDEALDATSDGQRLLLNIAFNYAGRTELVDAVRTLVASGAPPEIDRRGRRQPRSCTRRACPTQTS